MAEPVLHRSISWWPAIRELARSRHQSRALCLRRMRSRRLLSRWQGLSHTSDYPAHSSQALAAGPYYQAVGSAHPEHSGRGPQLCNIRVAVLSNLNLSCEIGHLLPTSKKNSPSDDLRERDWPNRLCFCQNKI